MILEIGRYRLAVGMEWKFTQAKAGVREQMKEISKAKGRAVFVADESSNGEWLGWEPHGGRQKAHAGAALIGLATPEAVIHHKLPDGNVWVCVLSQGYPVPGMGDRVLSPDEARAAFDEAFAMFATLQPYGDVPGSRGTLAELLEKVDEAVNAKVIAKKRIDALVLRSPGVDPRVLGVAALVLAVPVAGWFGWKEYQKFDTARKAAAMDAKLAAQKRMTAEQLEAERRRLREEFARKVATAKAEFAADYVHGQASAAWGAWRAALRQVPLVKAGYAPAGMDCDLTQCTVAWGPAGRFSLVTAKAEFGADPTDPTKEFSTQIALTVSPPREAAAAWASAAQVRATMIDSLLMVPALMVGPAQPRVETPPPDLGLSPITVGQRGPVSVQFTGPFALVQAEGAIRRLADFPVKLNTVKFVGLGKHLTVILDGTYVVPERQ